MRKLLAIGLVILLLSALIAGCSGDEDDAEAKQPENIVTGVIVLGDIEAEDPASKVARFQPLADYLAAHLNDYGIGVGEVKIAPDLDTMIDWMAAGEVQMYYDSPYPAMIVSERAGAKLVLRRWKDGVAVYHSVFFTRADSGITSLDDLVGQTVIALDHPSSTSGFMLPVAHLVSYGFEPVEKPSPDAAVGEMEIGYYFTGSDDLTIEAVLHGTAQVGVVDDQTFLNNISEKDRANLVILAETVEVPRQMVLVQPNMDPDLEAALITLLLGLKDSEEGLAILDTLKTAGFDAFPDGPDAVFASTHELYQIVSNGAVGTE